MTHLADVSGHIRTCRLSLIIRSTDKPDGNNLQC